MKINLFQNKLLLTLPVVLVLLFGSSATTQKAQAAVSACSPNNLHAGLITTDETWCAGGDNIHYLTGDVIVQAGATLTIAAGVTIDSAQATWWKYIIVQGHLNIAGTLAQPVFLTRSDPGNTPWGGLFFDGSQGDGSGDIQYATIEKAGANLGGCATAQHAVCVKDLPQGKQVNISHSTIRSNVSKGLYVINSAVSISDTAFNQQKYPILIDGAASVVTYSGNTFSGNAYPYYDNTQYTIQEDAIFISSDALTGHNFNLPAQTGLDAYVWWGNTSIPVGTTMSVAPGVTLRKEWGNYLTIQGHLEALGTPALPILFTGMPSSVPTVTLLWGGLFFDGTAGDGSGSLDYATIERGGDNLPPPGCTGICNAQNALLVKDLPSGKQVNLNHSTIDQSLAKGLSIVNSTVNVTNTTFSHNHYPIYIEGAASIVSYTGNNFIDNTFGYPNINYPMPLDAIVIAPDALMGHDFTLPAQTGLDAYVFTSGTTIPSGRKVTVQPGVTLRTGNAFLTVNGQLEAAGTSALPIRISGIPHYDDLANIYNWGGLVFDGSSGASGHLDHAIVEYGCQWWNGHGCATLNIYALAANKTVVVEHSLIQNSSDMDIAVIDSPTAQVDGNLIKGGRVGLYLASSLTVRNLAVTDQLVDGMVVETGYSVDARHLTIARTGRSGLYVHTGGNVVLKNSILSQNVLAVWVEGSGQAVLDTNLADANTTFKSGAVTDRHTFNGTAAFEADGYHIQAASAAVGKGQPGLCSLDIDGGSRPAPTGSYPDLGADEISAGRFSIFLPTMRR
jgi:hypothetical protein